VGEGGEKKMRELAEMNNRLGIYTEMKYPVKRPGQIRQIAENLSILIERMGALSIIGERKDFFLNNLAGAEVSVLGRREAMKKDHPEFILDDVYGAPPDFSWVGLVWHYHTGPEAYLYFDQVGKGGRAFWGHYRQALLTLADCLPLLVDKEATTEGDSLDIENEVIGRLIRGEKFPLQFNDFRALMRLEKRLKEFIDRVCSTKRTHLGSPNYGDIRPIRNSRGELTFIVHDWTIFTPAEWTSTKGAKIKKELLHGYLSPALDKAEGELMREVGILTPEEVTTLEGERRIRK